MRTAQIRLAEGRYRVRIEYVQTGGGFEMDWFCAEGDSPLEPVPWWMLSRRGPAAGTAIAARLLVPLRAISGVVAGLCAAWLLRRRWRDLLGLASIGLVAASTLPGDPTIRTSEYEYQVHLSAFKHLQWGVDVAPTYGPWGFVGIPLYHPGTFTALFLINTAIIAITAFRIVVFIRRIRPRAPLAGVWAAAALLPLTAITVAEWSAVLYSFQLLAMMMSVEWICLERERFEASDALSAMTLGFLTLVKISVWPLLPLLIIGAWVRSKRQAVLLAACLVVGATAAWVAAGQALSHLPAFVRYSADVILGYKNGMALWLGSAMPSALFLIAAAILLVALMRRFPPRRPSGWIAFIVPVAVFGQLFQAAFVRADREHIIPNVLALMAFAVLFMAATVHRRTPGSIVVPLCVAASLLLLLRASPGAPYYRRPAAELAGLRRLAVDGVTQLDIYRATTFARMRMAYPLPRETARGSVAIWSGDIGILEANEVPFAIEPTLTPYAAYTARLQELNAHWIDEARFDWMLWCGPATVDGRYPSEADSHALLSLSWRFAYQSDVRNCALLRRSAGREWIARDSEERHIGFDQLLPVPNGPGALVWAEVSVPRTVFGALTETILKPAPVLLRVVLKDGTTVGHPIMPSLTTAGFLLSPYTAAWQPLADLAAGGSSGKQVVGLQIERWALGALSSDRWYRPEATVRLTTFGAEQLTAAIVTRSAADPASDQGAYGNPRATDTFRDSSKTR